MVIATYIPISLVTFKDKWSNSGDINKFIPILKLTLLQVKPLSVKITVDAKHK